VGTPPHVTKFGHIKFSSLTVAATPGRIGSSIESAYQGVALATGAGAGTTGTSLPFQLRRSFYGIP
jgi:hypothetical protein